MNIEEDRLEVVKTANKYHDHVMNIKHHVEERMQMVDDLADHFVKMETFDDVRQSEVKARTSELLKVYELINNLS
mgnify:CR=1 FL=1